MSLVQAYICKEFILVGGEKRATVFDGSTLEDIVKVKKINNEVIIGITGTYEGNIKIFSDIFNEDLSIKKDSENMSYKEIVDCVTSLYNEHYEYLKTFGVHSVVCGWDGEKLTSCCFFSKPKKYKRPINHFPVVDNSLAIISCGKTEHYDNACRLSKEQDTCNIAQIKNLFKNVIDEGVKFDKTINKKVTFEKIRKKDMI